MNNDLVIPANTNGAGEEWEIIVPPISIDAIEEIGIRVDTRKIGNETVITGGRLYTKHKSGTIKFMNRRMKWAK